MVRVVDEWPTEFGHHVIVGADIHDHPPLLVPFRRDISFRRGSLSWSRSLVTPYVGAAFGLVLCWSRLARSCSCVLSAAALRSTPAKFSEARSGSTLSRSESKAQGCQRRGTEKWERCQQVFVATWFSWGGLKPRMSERTSAEPSASVQRPRGPSSSWHPPTHPPRWTSV